jgi:hypothetical protein
VLKPDWNRLGLMPTLGQSVRTTNWIENVNSLPCPESLMKRPHSGLVDIDDTVIGPHADQTVALVAKTEMTIQGSTTTPLLIL